MTADLVSKGHLVKLPFGTNKTYKHPTSLTLAERAIDAHHIEHFMKADLVEKGGGAPARATLPPLPPTRKKGPSERSGGARPLQAMPAGTANDDPYYWVCRRDPSLPKCQDYIY